MVKVIQRNPMKNCPECRRRIDNDTWNCTTCGFRAEVREGIPLLTTSSHADKSVSYPEEAHAQSFHYQEANFWFASRNRLLSYLTNRYFPAAESMMEIGCGTGVVMSNFSREIPRLKYLGTEVYISGLELAKQRLPTGSFIQMDAMNIPFDAEFDIIGAFDVLEHIEDDVCVLRQMYKALLPGGGILVTVPQHQWLWSYTDKHAGHKRRYSKLMLARKLSDAGLTPVYFTSFCAILLPFMVISRALGRLLSRRGARVRPKIQSGIILPANLNSALLAVQRLEMKIIRLGIAFPFGGSLVCVAKRA